MSCVIFTVFSEAILLYNIILIRTDVASQRTLSRYPAEKNAYVHAMIGFESIPTVMLLKHSQDALVSLLHMMVIPVVVPNIIDDDIVELNKYHS